MSKKTMLQQAEVELPIAETPMTAPPPLSAVPAPKYTDAELGLVDEFGRVLPPETRDIRYGTRMFWPEAERLGALCGLHDLSLWDLIQQVHAVRPSTWRDEVLDRLHARIADPVGSMTGAERMMRGLQHDLSGRIAEAWANLEGLLRPMAEAKQLHLLELLAQYVSKNR